MADITTGTPTGTGNPSNGAPIGINPTIWTGSLMHNYYEKSVVPLITKKAPVIHGDKLIYSLASPVNINKGTTSDDETDVIYQSVKPTTLSIEMDKTYDWAIKCSNIELFQTNLDLLNGEMQEAADGLDEAISQDVYADIFASAGQKMGAIEVSGLNAYDTLVNMGTMLNKKKVPKRGRYIVIDNDYLGMLTMDPRFQYDPTVLENGIVEGRKIGGFTILVTDDIPTLKGGAKGIFAIQRDGYGYGTQFDNVEFFEKLEQSRGQAVRGQVLAGYGVLRPNNIVSAQVTYNTEIQPNVVD